MLDTNETIIRSHQILCPSFGCEGYKSNSGSKTTEDIVKTRAFASAPLHKLQSPLVSTRNFANLLMLPHAVAVRKGKAMIKLKIVNSKHILKG